MSVRLFVGNLPYDVTETELMEFFSAVGPPLSVRMPTDRETGSLRGFAFVEWSDTAQAEDAVRRFHQQVFKGRPLVVNEARPREEGSRSRSNAFTGARGSGALGPTDRAKRPDQPTRTFGPDSLPRGKRKPRGHGAMRERGLKGPIPERGGGQFFAESVDDSEDDQGVDEVAFWLRATPDNHDDE